MNARVVPEMVWNVVAICDEPLGEVQLAEQRRKAGRVHQLPNFRRTGTACRDQRRPLRANDRTFVPALCDTP